MHFWVTSKYEKVLFYLSKVLRMLKGGWEKIIILPSDGSGHIGFTKSVDNETIKYLICADCDVGPIGWHCISTKKNYVALARVKHS